MFRRFRNKSGLLKEKRPRRTVKKEIVCLHCYDATHFVTKAKGSRVYLEPNQPILPLEKIGEEYRSCRTYGGLRRKFPIIAAFSHDRMVRVSRFAEE